MKRTFSRLPSQFFRISLRTAKDSLTLALVPDKEHAHLITRLLVENYGLRNGEVIVVLPTILRPVKSTDSTDSTDSTASTASTDVEVAID